MKPLNALKGAIKGMVLALLLPIVPAGAAEWHRLIPPAGAAAAPAGAAEQPHYFEAFLLSHTSVPAFVPGDQLLLEEMEQLARAHTPIYRIYHLKGLFKEDKEKAVWLAISGFNGPPDKMIVKLVDWTAMEVNLLLYKRRWVLVESSLFLSSPELRRYPQDLAKPYRPKQQ